MSNTGIYAADLRELVRQVLEGLAKDSRKPGLDSEDAQELVLRTIVAEGLIGGNFHLRQKLSKGRIGRARGIAQFEPWVARSVINDYLEYREFLIADIQRVCLCDLSMIDDETPEEMALMDLQLQGNMLLNIALCRFKYRPVPHPIPPADDIDAQAKYWLDYYNAGGAGTLKKFRLAAERTAL